MVWLARWRPKWKNLFIGTMIVASLATAVKGLQEYAHYLQDMETISQQYTHVREAISQIVRFEDDIKDRMSYMETLNQRLRAAEEYKTLAEKLVNENKIIEAERNYQAALNTLNGYNDDLPGVEIEYMGKKLAYLKGLVPGKYLNEIGITGIEKSLNDANQKVRELGGGVSQEIKKIERIIGGLETQLEKR